VEVGDKKKDPHAPKRKAEDDIEDPKKKSENPKTDEGFVKSSPVKRFKITLKEEEFRWSLPQDLVDYLTEHLETFIPDKDLKVKVLDQNPVPTNCPSVRKLDEFLNQFMSKHTERLDMTFCRIEEKIRDILGPLSRL